MSISHFGPLRVTAKELNFRVGPAASHRIIRELPRGTMVLAEGDASPGWVRCRGDVGYVAAR